MYIRIVRNDNKNKRRSVMYDYYDYGSSYYSRPHTYSSAYSSSATSAAVGGVLGFVAFMWILCLVLGVLTIIGRWKISTRRRLSKRRFLMKLSLSNLSL